MLLTTMIDPTKDVRTQVEATNVNTGGLPPLILSDYLSRAELAKIGYQFDKTHDAERPGFLISAALPLISSALIAEQDVSKEFAAVLVSEILNRPDADPTNAFNERTVDHVADYFQYAYKKVRIEIFVASMEEFQAFHKLFVPVERVRFFPEEILLRRLKTPSYTPTMAEASAAFQVEPMTSFSIMYAMSTHQVFSTVPLPEFRAMMLPMSYQLWKQEILTPKDVAGDLTTDDVANSKSMKLALKDAVIK